MAPSYHVLPPPTDTSRVPAMVPSCYTLTVRIDTNGRSPTLLTEISIPCNLSAREIKQQIQMKALPTFKTIVGWNGEVMFEPTDLPCSLSDTSSDPIVAIREARPSAEEPDPSISVVCLPSSLNLTISM